MYNQPSSSDIPASDFRDSPRKTAVADKKDLIFLLLSFVALFLLIDFGFAGGMRLGFTVAYAVLFLVTTLYLAKKGNFQPFPVVCGILSLCIVPVFALYCESITLAVAFLAVFFLWAIYAGAFGGVIWHGIGGFRLIYDALRILLVYPFTFLSAPFKGLRLAEKSGKKLSGIGYVLIGLALGIPAMAIILPLMIKSDAAFSLLLEKIFGKIGTLLIHIVLALLLTPLLIALFFALRHRLPNAPAQGSSVRFIVSPVVCGFFGLLSFFYLLYLFSQLTYFFSAFQRILPEGYSYADYARQGFFELCAISIINFVLMFCAFTLVKKEEGATDIPGAVKGFGIFISLFNLVLVGTAVSKMILYIDFYGLTELRVLTTVFMIMMGIAFICLIVRLIVPKFPYMAVSLIVCTLLGAGVLYADVNTTIARYNTDAYLFGDLATVDISTLEDLGAAAVPYLDRLYRDAADGSVRRQALSALNSIKDRDSSVGGFRQYNLTEARAKKILESYPGNLSGFPSADIIFSNGYGLLKENGQFNLCLQTGENEYCTLVENVVAYRFTDGFISLEIKKKGSFLRYYLVDTVEQWVSDPMTVEKLNQMLTEQGIVISGWKYV